MVSQLQGVPKVGGLWVGCTVTPGPTPDLKPALARSRAPGIYFLEVHPCCSDPQSGWELLPGWISVARVLCFCLVSHCGGKLLILPFSSGPCEIRGPRYQVITRNKLCKEPLLWTATDVKTQWKPGAVGAGLLRNPSCWRDIPKDRPQTNQEERGPWAWLKFEETRIRFGGWYQEGK